jgi:Cu-Zn family superoxide dismutase
LVVRLVLYCNDKIVVVVFEPKAIALLLVPLPSLKNDGFVTMVAKLKGLTQEFTHTYIHEKSDCTAADGSSVEVIESNFKKHGKLGEGEAHKGDIGNS